MSAWPLISFRCGARTATWKASTYPYVRCDLTRPTQHLGPHAPTFLALVVQERRSVVPHVEAHPPHRYVAFRARCRWPQPDSLPNRPGSARGHSLSSSREEIEEARRSPTRSGTSTTGAVRSVVSRTGAWSTAPPSVVQIDVQRPAGPRTLVQRANGRADRRRLSPRASSPPTTSFGLLQHAAEAPWLSTMPPMKNRPARRPSP